MFITNPVVVILNIKKLLTIFRVASKGGKSVMVTLDDAAG